MSNEQATNDAEQKPGKLTESIDRMADVLKNVLKTASSAYDRLPHVELRDGQGAAWCLLSKAIGEIRHVLGPCAIMPEACFHKLHEFANQPRGTGEFFTPKEVLDAVTANPPLGDVKDAPRPLDPNAPEIVTGGGTTHDGRGFAHEPSGGGEHPLCHGNVPEDRCKRCGGPPDGRAFAYEAALRLSAQSCYAQGACGQGNGGTAPCVS